MYTKLLNRPNIMFSVLIAILAVLSFWEDSDAGHEDKDGCFVDMCPEPEPKIVRRVVTVHKELHKPPLPEKVHSKIDSFCLANNCGFGQKIALVSANDPVGLMAIFDSVAQADSAAKDTTLRK